MNYLHQNYFHTLRNPGTSKQYISIAELVKAHNM